MIELTETMRETLHALKKQAHITHKVHRDLVAALEAKRQPLAEAIMALTEHFNEENKQLLGNIESAKEAEEASDKALRDWAIKLYSETKDKQIDDHISVRVNTSLEYDQDKAMKWATDHNLCLALDKKAFEKVADTVQLDFVEKVEKPTAVIKKEMYENYG